MKSPGYDATPARSRSEFSSVVSGQTAAIITSTHTSRIAARWAARSARLREHRVPATAPATIAAKPITTNATYAAWTIATASANSSHSIVTDYARPGALLSTGLRPWAAGPVVGLAPVVGAALLRIPNCRRRSDPRYRREYPSCRVGRATG